MRFVFTLFSSICAVAFSHGSGLDSVTVEREGNLLIVIHEVEEQETLFAISRRYKSSIQSIVDFNNIADSRIEIGQRLRIIYGDRNADAPAEVVSNTPDGMHLVLAGETLYSISRKYDLKVKELRRLNSLESNALTPGTYLKVSEAIEIVQDLKSVDSLMIEVDTVVVDANGIPEGFEEYIVQTAETLNSIAIKRNINVDDIKKWNGLDSDYIRIGQTLIVRNLVADSTGEASADISTTRLNEDGFERIYEEGIAAQISEISTTKYLALHRKLPIGTELEVRNLMNNLVVHVKVVGKLPDTGINRNILLRLSRPAYEKLGILDPKSRVEVSHFKK